MKQYSIKEIIFAALFASFLARDPVQDLAVLKINVGETISLKIWRGGKIITLPVVLTEKP